MVSSAQGHAWYEEEEGAAASGGGQLPSSPAKRELVGEGPDQATGAGGGSGGGWAGASGEGGWRAGAVFGQREAFVWTRGDRRPPRGRGATHRARACACPRRRDRRSGPGAAAARSPGPHLLPSMRPSLPGKGVQAVRGAGLSLRSLRDNHSRAADVPNRNTFAACASEIWRSPAPLEAAASQLTHAPPPSPHPTRGWAPGGGGKGRTAAKLKKSRRAGSSLASRPPRFPPSRGGGVGWTELLRRRAGGGGATFLLNAAGGRRRGRALWAAQLFVHAAAHRIAPPPQLFLLGAPRFAPGRRTRGTLAMSGKPTSAWTPEARALLSQAAACSCPAFPAPN